MLLQWKEGMGADLYRLPGPSLWVVACPIGADVEMLHRLVGRVNARTGRPRAVAHALFFRFQQIVDLANELNHPGRILLHRGMPMPSATLPTTKKINVPARRDLS